MIYLKCFFFNFLIVFFANYLLPGLNVTSRTRIPHLEGEIPFALALGFLNSLIYPILKLIGRCSVARLAVFALVINFAAYALLKLLSVGIRILTVEGYILASVVVTAGSFAANYIEMRRSPPKIPPPSTKPLDPPSP